jgi:hypothetical protein
MLNQNLTGLTFSYYKKDGSRHRSDREDWEGRTESRPGRQPLRHIPEDANGLNTGPQRSLNITSYGEKKYYNIYRTLVPAVLRIRYIYPGSPISDTTRKEKEEGKNSFLTFL